MQKISFLGLLILTYAGWLLFHLVYQMEYDRLMSLSRIPDAARVDARFRRAHIRDYLSKQVKEPDFLVMGNSQLFGHGVPEAYLFTHALPGTVVNVALNGCNLKCLEVLSDLVAESGIRAGRVVWNLDLNFFRNWNGKGGGPFLEKKSEPKPGLVSQFAGDLIRSSLSERLKIALNPKRLSRFSLGGLPSDYMKPSNDWDKGVKGVDEIFSSLTTQKILIPSPYDLGHLKHSGFDPEQIRKDMESLISSFESLGWKICRMAEYSEEGYWPRKSFKDVIHLTPEGHEKLAENLKECLKEQNF